MKKVNITQAAISEIQQRMKEDIKKDFLSGLNEDGTIPRGLLSSLAKKYGYTQTGITKVLRGQGIILERKANLNNIQDANPL